jgi:cyanophycin synthetase
VPTSLRLAAELARARVRHLAAAAGVRPPGSSAPTRYVWQRVAEHRRCWAAAAESVGAEFFVLSERIWDVRRAGRSTRIANDLIELDDPVTLEVAGDKELCYRLASAAGVRVPEYVVVERSNADRALEQVPRGWFPLVVKPARGTSAGIGVTVGVRTRAELPRAAAAAFVHGRRVIVQRMVAGETCRLLFLDGGMIHAVRRRGLRVVPDGRSTVAQLLGADLPVAGLSPLVAAFLAAGNLTLDSVLPPGPAIPVSGVPAGERTRESLRTIYDEDITRLVSPKLAAEAARFVSVVGSKWAGVDVVTPDPNCGLDECGAVIEINTTPGILHHCPSDGSSCPVAETVLERLLAPRR